MEFRNLTPLHAIAFNAVDVQRNEFHVVALKAGYRLEPTLAATDSRGDTHTCVLLEGDEAALLTMADEFEGETGKSSTKFESDLAPFKPKCDVLIRATSYSPSGIPAESWPARVRVMDGEKLVVEKGLRVWGPRFFRKTWRGWRCGRPELSEAVQIRWEYAYGGTSIVTPGDSTEDRLNEVCFTNPLGCGWVEARYFDRAKRKETRASPDILSEPKEQAGIDILRAPQIEAWDDPINDVDRVKHPGTEIDSKHMAEIARRYRHEPIGLGPIGRAWTPRLQRAGTYDAAWAQTVWPHLPRDFDFRYWNAAPDDQQIPWPESRLAFELANLAQLQSTRAGFLRACLPEHRALVALRFTNGAIAPIAMKLDTMLIDTEEMKVSATWRAVFPLKPEVRVCEARFETDACAPLLRIDAKSRVTEGEETWQTT
jgi:hypothetical protein